MMTSAQVVETSVTTTDNSPSQDYTHPDDQTTLLQIKLFLLRVSSHFAPWLYRSESVRFSQKLDRSTIKVTSLHTKVSPLHTEVTSLASTYRFQKKGLTGEVARALCSTSSITMLAMTAETGEPIAVPKTC